MNGVTLVSVRTPAIFVARPLHNVETSGRIRSFTSKSSHSHAGSTTAESSSPNWEISRYDEGKHLHTVECGSNSNTVTPEQIPCFDTKISGSKVRIHSRGRPSDGPRQGTLGILCITLQKLEQRHQGTRQGPTDIHCSLICCILIILYFDSDSHVSACHRRIDAGRP